MTAKKTYTEVRYVNKHIRDMLTCFGFGKCEVGKAVALLPLKEQPKANELDKMCIYSCFYLTIKLFYKVFEREN